jgi:cytochrome P450
MAKIMALAREFDPYPAYRQLRESTPVTMGDRMFAWHVFAYDDVQRLLSEHGTFSSQLGGDQPPDVDRPFAASLLNTDPPRHRELRSLVQQAFTLRNVEALAPRITEIAHGLVDRFIASGGTELVSSFANPLPVTVISELLGIPAEDSDRFKRWSDLVVTQSRGQPDADAPEHERAHQQMVEYFLDLIERRRRHPGGDLVSMLLAAQIDGEHLSVPELLGFCVLLLVAGNETTTNLLGNAVLSFDENPGTIEALRGDPSLLPGAVEEALRYRSPVQSMYRIAAADTVLGEQAIAKGTPLVAWIGSANRDPLRFPDPDVFDIRRTPNRHLAFGQGVHFCLGAPLARLEARIALGVLLDRLPGLAVVPDARLERMDSSLLYGLKSLPVTWRTS